ncbi:MAG: hypothetical protein BIFFINMI_00789 [Phycisphaerae bacterium]|nr:hypothetical protein [Phycisphaerae bacterium]
MMRHRLSRLGLALSILLPVLLAAGCDRPPAHPFVVSPPFGPVAMVCATSMEAWVESLENLGDLQPDSIVHIPQIDREGKLGIGAIYAWARDAWVFGWVDGQPAVLLMPAGEPLHDFAREQFPDSGTKVIDADPLAFRGWNRFDAGGDVVVSPPTSANPMGRIIVGRHMSPHLARYFRRQRLQTGPDGGLIELDTDWLRVGHVDEIVAFVPSALPPGYRLVVADPIGALELIRKTPAQRAVFYQTGSRELAGQATGGGEDSLEDRGRDFKSSGASWRYVRLWSGAGGGQVARIARVEAHRLVIDKVWDLRDPVRRGHGVVAAVSGIMDDRCDSQETWYEPPDATTRYLLVEGTQFWRDGGGESVPAVVAAGELAEDTELAAAARRLADRIDGPDGIVATVRAGVGGIRRRDVIRLPVLAADDGQGNEVWWLTPNAVNLVNLNGTAVVLQPFGPRTDPADDDSDALRDAAERRMAEQGAVVDFVNGWDSLHRGGGGARCGTNVLRHFPKSLAPTTQPDSDEGAAPAPKATEDTSQIPATDK